MRLGTAIANVFTRGPATLAMSAAGLADLAPGRFCLGIGAGSQPIVEAWNGARFARPATRVRETVQVLRAALAGERVVFKGKTLTRGRLPSHPAAGGPVPIYIAALRPGMLQGRGRGGRRRDPQLALARRRAALGRRWCARPRSGRARSRRRSRSPRGSSSTLDPPGPESELAVRRHMAAYLNVPVYRAFQEWLGRAEALGPMWQAWERGDRKARGGRGPAEVMDDLILRGPMAEIRAHVQRYLDGRHRHRVPAGLHAGGRSRAQAPDRARRHARARPVRNRSPRDLTRPQAPDEPTAVCPPAARTKTSLRGPRSVTPRCGRRAPG